MVSAAYALQLPPGTAEAELAAATLASLPPTFSQPEWGLQRAFSREGSEGSEGESKRDARSFVASCMRLRSLRLRSPRLRSLRLRSPRLRSLRLRSPRLRLLRLRLLRLRSPRL